MARQYHLDGMSIDANKARFTGTFDLDEEDLEALSLDRTVFFIVGVRVSDANCKVLDTGDVRRTDVLSVVDARVAAGELREVAMAHLMGKGGQEVAFAQKFGTATEEQKAEEARFLETQQEKERPADVDEDGVRTTPDEYESTDEEPEIEVVGHIKDALRQGDSFPGGDGPKVAKFNPAAFEGGGSVVEREVVGTVYGHKRSDSALARFMDEDVDA
jgi:hypothetical protein